MNEQVDILVAEDDEHISFILSHAFERSNFNIKIVNDGKAAMSAVDELTLPPRLALLDIMMPYYSGINVLKKIRATEGWNDIPVVMLTAKSQEKDIIEAIKLGANEYITKPFQIGELLVRIQRYLG